MRILLVTLDGGRRVSRTMPSTVIWRGRHSKPAGATHPETRPERSPEPNTNRVEGDSQWVRDSIASQVNEKVLDGHLTRGGWRSDNDGLRKQPAGVQYFLALKQPSLPPTIPTLMMHDA